MPVMDGYEATRQIRSSTHPCAATIPIIAMTANAFQEDIERSRQASMDAHISKPLDMKDLRVAVAACGNTFRKEDVK